MAQVIPRLICLCVLLFPQLSSAASDGFARLEDGTIVAVEKRTAELLTYRKSDGSAGQVAAKEVDGWLAAKAADRLVDRLLPMVGMQEKHEEVQKELGKLQMAAVPRVLHHLKTGDERRRMEAIAALQFVWSAEAEVPVRAVLDDENESIRRIAMRLLQTRVPGDHSDLLDKAAKDANPTVSGPALRTLLLTKPDPERLAKALEVRGRWRYLHALLPRYHDRARLGKITHRMLDTRTLEVQASALCAVIHQYDLTSGTEEKVLKFLANENPSIRMRAAEYLRWHGDASSLDTLKSELMLEKSLHCRAVKKEAIKAIEHRTDLFARPLSNRSHDWEGDFDAASMLALTDWAEGPVTSALRIATFKLLASRSFEPYFIYEGAQGDRNDAGERYLELVNRVAGYPGPGVVQAAMRQVQDEEAPGVDSLIPPVQDYFDPKRKSFGIYIGDEHGGPFQGSHHVGDDVSFGHQHETVVAIGDGIVRYALVGALSWGGIVIIEHHDKKTDQRFCSLYSHLGPLLCVKAGDQVRQGDMLGSLGRDNTMATGGYVSHLHFGIHLTAFSGSWITGYLSPKQFEADHSWTDPQPFIRERMK